MTAWGPLLMAIVAGLALGIMYFGGLWWTIRALPNSRWSRLWFAGSFLARTVVIAGGFSLILITGWGYLLACLVGFIFARLLVMLWIAKSDARNRRG